MICGKCGRRMSPRYYGDGGYRASYECNQHRKQDGKNGICWTVSAAAIDEAISLEILKAVNPSQIALSLAVLEELDQQAQARDEQWRLKLERIQYEAQKAERQYNAVEPENRLVARTLEKLGHEKLEQLVQVETAYTSAKTVECLELSPEQRQQILALASDLPSLWNSPTTTVIERKEMLSLLVRQVALTPIDSPSRQTRVDLLWHTGATTQLTVARPSRAEKFQTPQQVIEMIRQFSELSNKALANQRSGARFFNWQRSSFYCRFY